MKSPKNKMVSTDELSHASEGREVKTTASGQPMQVGAEIPFEGQHEKQMFWIPAYGMSVEAETMEEAVEIAKERSVKQS